MSAVVREITDADDPAIAGFGAMQTAAYFAPETLIPAQYIPRLLMGETGTRRNFLIVAELDGQVVGGALSTGWPRLGVASRAFSGWRASSVGMVSRGNYTSSACGCWTECLAGAWRVCSSTWSALSVCRTVSSSVSGRRAPILGIADGRSSTWASGRSTFATSSPSAARTAGRSRFLTSCSAPGASGHGRHAPGGCHHARVLVPLARQRRRASRA